jgi:L-alanine-DL-glutamate epimerase-like enolase superfamily enzyme
LPEALCPYYEYLVNWHEYGEWFYREKYVAENGWIRLPEGPGLGMAFDEGRIEKRKELDL